MKLSKKTLSKLMIKYYLTKLTLQWHLICAYNLFGMAFNLEQFLLKYIFLKTLHFRQKKNGLELLFHRLRDFVYIKLEARTKLTARYENLTKIRNLKGV